MTEILSQSDRIGAKFER